MNTLVFSETSHIPNNMIISCFQVVTETFDTKMLSYEVIDYAFLRIGGSNLYLLQN